MNYILTLAYLINGFRKNEMDEETKGVIKNNSMSKKRTKGKTTIHTTLYRKLNFDQCEPTKIGDVFRCSGREYSRCFTCDIRRITAKRHEYHLTWKSCYSVPLIDFNLRWNMFIIIFDNKKYKYANITCLCF